MVLASFLVGGVAAAIVWVSMAPAFAHDVFARQNYRARVLPTAVGVVIAVVVIVANAVVAVTLAAGVDTDAGLVRSFQFALVAAVGFALLGMFDDLGGTGESGGFSGHLRALARGRLTTGALKLFAGAAVGVVVASLVITETRPEETGTRALVGLLADGALIALAANLANLFDRAPGRVIKLSVLAFAGLVVAVGASPELAGIALVVGAGTGLVWPDLREQLMLGDTGANVLGAALGLGVVLMCSSGVRTGVLLVVAALNLASERVSFSWVIDSIRPLRYVDRLGRH